MAGGMATLAAGGQHRRSTPGNRRRRMGDNTRPASSRARSEEKLREFAQAENKLRSQTTVMNAGQKRIDELKTSIAKVRTEAENKIGAADPESVEDAHQVYKLAKTLATLMEEPVLTREQQRILQQ